MPAPAAPATWSDLYGRAWKVCCDLWPLWLARFFYLILNYGAFLLCLVFTFWPLLSKVLGMVRGGESLGQGDYQALVADFFSNFRDAGFLLPVLAIFFFYLAWWTVISAWFAGGLYARLNAWVKRGEAFSWTDFVKEGFYHLVPMILLQGLLGTVALLGVGAYLIAMVLGGFVLGLAHVPGWAALVALLPAGLVFFAILIFWDCFAMVSQSCLVETDRVFEAFEKGCRACLADGFDLARMVGVLITVFTIVFVAALLFFKLLELIPLVGLFFFLSDVVLRLFVALVSDVYFPALAVVGLHEKEADA
ncbi:MAG TPA: hypothetical protein VFR02_05150 [bacterium]|nr:hypothetical protein [bacterium]